MSPWYCADGQSDAASVCLPLTLDQLRPFRTVSARHVATLFTSLIFALPLVAQSPAPRRAKVFIRWTWKDSPAL